MSIIDVNETNTHKKIKICGIKLNIKYNYKKIHQKCAENYSKTIERLKNKVKENKPLRVLFYVVEKQKWGYQQLFDEMQKDPMFEPIVIADCLTDSNSDFSYERCSIDENVEFFKEHQMPVESAYVNGEHIELLKFEPDIIFFQQPWYISDANHPIRMSEYALCCYCSYSIATSKTASTRKPLFFYNIWKYFLAHDCMKDEYESWMEYNKDGLVVTGHPKLDVYKEYSESDIKDSKHYVIYAPHFSVGKSILSFSTFDWSGQFMLEYAKAHPEINWVFKPHPRIRSFFLERNIMTQEEIDNYYEEWNKIAYVYDDADYFDIFKNSDAMITDCGSFCVEYFFTGKPLLHMISESSKPHSALNRLVNKNHYIICNKETLKEYLDEIVIRKNDFLKGVRKNALKEIFGEKQDSTHNIIEYIKKELDV